MILSVMQISSIFQFYRIVMQSSQKSKSRKPIFGNKQNNKDSKLDKLCQTTSSYLKQSVSLTKTHPHLFESTMIQSNWQIPLNRSNSVAKITIPMNVRTYSPPKIIQQQNTHVVLNKNLAPQVQAMPIYNQAPFIQQSIVPTPFSQTQPQFYKSQGPSKVTFNCSTPKFQTKSITEKMIRSNELKPTVVAVERVMKQLGQNTLPAECKVKAYQNTTLVHNIVEPDRPDRLQVFNQIHRKNVPYVQKIHKLQEINGLLSRNYDVILDEVQALKQEQYTYEDVIDQNKFIRKAANLFENLLNVQMHKALNEIEYVHKVEKRCVSNYRKQYGNYFFR